MAQAAYEARLQFRNGALSTQTSGITPGHIQANLLIVPSSAAKDFRDLCVRNPVPCPLLAMSSQPGNPHSFDGVPAAFSHDVDIRTDVPKYNIYRSGKLVATKTDIKDEWNDDHVAFLLGCSFSFEAALARAGFPCRHWEEPRRNVSMYRTTRKLIPAGRFIGASHVVSMRPYLPEQVEQVRDVTRPFLAMHGEPLAWGWEAMDELGIKDIDRPDFGDPVPFREGEVPVFWGCGVTPQAAVMEAGSKIKGTVIGHAPGHMVILDMTEDDVFGSVEGKVNDKLDLVRK